MPGDAMLDPTARASAPEMRVARCDPGPQRMTLGADVHLLSISLAPRPDPMRVTCGHVVEAPAPRGSFSFLPAGEARVLETVRSGPAVLIRVAAGAVAATGLHRPHPTLLHSFDPDLAGLGAALLEAPGAERRSLARRALSRAARHLEAGGPTDRHGLGCVETAVLHIEANLAAPLPLERVAAVAGQSQFHFARRFREVTGESVHRFVMGRRALRAELLLRETDDPIAEVAHAAGFGSQSHMTTVVRRLLGRTPAQLRRLARAAPDGPTSPVAASP